jgi:peptidyl-tRNA hydrolase
MGASILLEPDMTIALIDNAAPPQDLLDAIEVLRRYIHPEVLADEPIDGGKYQVRDPDMPEKKMWLIVRTDIKMRIEKGMPQAGHGVLTSWVRGLFQNPIVALGYLNEAQPKISVRVKKESDLHKAYRLCQEAGLPSVLIKDAARTFFSEPTFTVACVGPCYKSDLPKFVRNLQLLVTEETVVLPGNGEQSGGDH